MATTTSNILVIDGDCKVIEDHVTAESGFPSIGGVFNLKSGKWYYEVLLNSDGIMQIGFAESGFSPKAKKPGKGVGDDIHSWGYDGYRKRKWNGSLPKNNEKYGDHKWKCGDVVGCAVDIDHGQIAFYLNGKNLGIAFKSIKFNNTVFPAASLQGFGKNTKQSITFLFDNKPLYTPNGYKAINSINISDEKEQENCEECLKLKQELIKTKETVRILKHQINKLQEEKKENELTILQMKAMNVDNYEKWKHNDILFWILSIEDDNGDKIFEKYEDALSKELANNALKGTDLVKIEKTDLKDLGINVFKDRNFLYEKIKQLISNNKKANNVSDHINDNVAMNEGLNEATAYI